MALSPCRLGPDSGVAGERPATSSGVVARVLWLERSAGQL